MTSSTNEGALHYGLVAHYQTDDGFIFRKPGHAVDYGRQTDLSQGEAKARETRRFNMSGFTYQNHGGVHGLTDT